MKLAFTLSMPSVNSWNGKWSGEDRSHVIVKTLPESAASAIRGKSFHYSFGDGWVAAVAVSEVDTAEAERLTKQSAGFCGYDWMIDSILTHGDIRA